MSYGLTSAGWVPKTAAVLLAEIEADFRAALGDDVDVSAESVFGPLIATQVLKLAELWELAGAIYAARTPSGGSGASLDAAAGLCPGIERRAATKGTVTLSITLNNGVTVPAGSRAHVVGEPTNAWVTTESVTNSGGSPAAVSVEAEALDTGRTPANTATITVIATPVSGWTAVTNLADAVPGLPVETDAELRLRREQSLARNASSPIDAIAAQVAEVEGVTQCVAWENTTLYTDSAGRPAKSVEVMVLGGAAEDLARAIWAAKAGGIETYGTTTTSFADDRGTTRTVKFSRPTDLNLYATVQVEYDPDTYAGDAEVEDAFLAAVSGLRAGERARISDMVTAVCAVTGVVDAYVWVGITGTLSEQSRDNAYPGERSRCVFDSARIDIVRVVTA